MDADFVKQIHGNTYRSKVNAIIPWAGIQPPPHCFKGDPNPGSANYVAEDGTYELRDRVLTLPARWPIGNYILWEMTDEDCTILG